jgi:HSP20 family protein
MRIIRYTQPYGRNFCAPLARSPWAGLEAEVSRLFEAAQSEPAPAETTVRFPLDIYEDAQLTTVRAELPGVDRAAISVELVEGTLQVGAKRQLKTGDREETVILRRSIRVPEGTVQADKVSAAYENGVLTVTLPKREEAKPTKVTVAVA